MTRSRRLGIHRRNFHRLAAGMIAALPTIVRGTNLNERLDVAIIGCGGRGAGNLREVAGENIVALCDVDSNAVERAADKHKHARKFTDFRKLFESPGGFDAVVVSTCEHTHALATMLALKNKKHVYCEKPLTHNVWEARQIREAAARTPVATQMGIQIHAADNYRRVVEIVQAGVIGPIRESHVWVGRAWGLQSSEAAARNKDIVAVSARPQEVAKAPAGLNWDLWIGPAPMRPFHPVYVPGPKWYRWWDFGNGTMSDLGSHFNDLPFWALKLQAPLTVEAVGPKPHAEIAPASMSVVYEYGPRDNMPATKVVWHQGENKPPHVATGAIPNWSSGILFIGEKGMLLADYGRFKLLPEKAFVDVRLPEPTLPRSPGHHAEWIAACKSGKSPSANFEYAGWLTEANHLGNVAFRVGKRIEWDAAKMVATNAPQAATFLRRAYRKGWEL